jgi:hypothetical protein
MRPLPGFTLEVWPFGDKPETAVFTTRGVLERRDPIVFVRHDADDGHLSKRH